jgi:hypothetical protein
MLGKAMPIVAVALAVLMVVAARNAIAEDSPCVPCNQTVKELVAACATESQYAANFLSIMYYLEDSGAICVAKGLKGDEIGQALLKAAAISGATLRKAASKTPDATALSVIRPALAKRFKCK